MYYMAALGKTVHADADVSTLTRRGYHYRGVHDALVQQTVQIERPGLIMPRTSCSMRVTQACLASCMLATFTLKSRHGLSHAVAVLGMTVLYAVSVASQQCNKGVRAHWCGFTAACVGGFVCTTRMFMQYSNTRNDHGSFGRRYYGGNRRAAAGTRWPRRLLCTLVLLAWYEYGRAQVWTEYANELADTTSGELVFDVLADYVPSTIDKDLVEYRTQMRNGATR